MFEQAAHTHTVPRKVLRDRAGSAFLSRAEAAEPLRLCFHRVDGPGSARLVAFFDAGRFVAGALLPFDLSETGHDGRGIDRWWPAC